MTMDFFDDTLVVIEPHGGGAGCVIQVIIGCGTTKLGNCGIYCSGDCTIDS